MIDSQKIDAYFEDRKVYNTPDKASLRQFAWRRLLKITLPCIAAVLLGVMTIMPNIKKSAALPDSTTIPHKGEMEKLHMEETKFNITDNKNRINKIVAQKVDETEPGSQLYKITAPQGEIPTDNGVINITSEIGYFNQNNNLLELKHNVKAIIDNDTTVNTEYAVYDFNREKGYGNTDVSAHGNWGNMQAQGFAYDKNTEVLTLKGKHQITNPQWSLTADKKTLIYKAENKSISWQNALFTQNEKNLYADKIIAYFDSGKKQELRHAKAIGNVRIITAKELITGAKAEYDSIEGKAEIFGAIDDNQSGSVEITQGKNKLRARRIEVFIQPDNSIKQAFAFGNVIITTPKGSASGNRGVYNPTKNIVELYDSVKIEQDGNIISGAYAQTDLNTSVSKISGGNAAKGRVSGTFIRKNQKDNNHENAKK